MQIRMKAAFLIILFSLAVLSMSAPAFAMNDIRYSPYHNMTPEEIQRIVDETTGTQIDRFDFILSHREDALGIYGVIPEKAKGIEAYEYWMEMVNISKALAQDEVMQSYLYENGGPIIGQGTQCVCYTSIIVLEERAHEFTEADMLAIKERVDYYASLEGQTDSPLVFFKEKMGDSYLTEEQLFELWASGDEGLTITDGLENLTQLQKSGFVNTGSGSVSSKISFWERLLFVFSNKADSYGLPLSEYLESNGFADNKLRPVVGGLMISTSTSGGTVGYAAKDVHTPDLYGIVTVAHVFYFENKTAYQPKHTYGDENALGTFTKICSESDSVFIPMDLKDLRPIIYTGEGDNQFLNVIGYESAVSSGMTLNKSGAVSGNSAGSYYGVRYNQTFTVKNGTINYTVNHVGILKELSEDFYSVPGDSGGPVYVKTKAVINGTEQEAAVLLGIIEGGDSNGTVYYVPSTAIQERLGIAPLTVYDV